LDAQFRRLGYEVYTAHDGMQAMKLYEQAQPTLVITELMLPMLNGFQLIRELRRREKQSGRPSSRIIVLSGNRIARNIARCYELGASDYMHKPFSPHELEARIRTQVTEETEAMR